MCVRVRADAYMRPLSDDMPVGRHDRGQPVELSYKLARKATPSPGSRGGGSSATTKVKLERTAADRPSA